jgi:pectate lyase
LGITDQTTFLLTSKEIREGAGAETKLITSAEAIQLNVPNKINGYIGNFRSKLSYMGSFDLPLFLLESEENEFTIDFNNAKQEAKLKVYINSNYLPQILNIEPKFWEGDLFSTNIDNINELIITYLGNLKISVENKIYDEPSWFKKLIVNGMFNDNRSLAVQNDTLQNNVFWPTSDVNIQTQQGGANSVTFQDLGDGNFAVRSGVLVTAPRGRIVLVTNQSIKDLLQESNMTVITRFRGGGGTASKTILSNYDATQSNKGFRISFLSTQLRFDLGDGDGLNRAVASGITSTTNSMDWIDAAFVADVKFDVLRIYAQSLSLNTPFSLRTLRNATTYKDLNTGLDMRFDQSENTSFSVDFLDRDYMIIYFGVLDQITIKKIIDNPQNTISILKDYEKPVPTITFPQNFDKPTGWAGLYDDGKGVNGGTGGVVREFYTFKELVTALETCDKDRREIYRLIGNDYEGEGITSTLSTLSNKTIEGLGQKISSHNIQFFGNGGNIILRNLKIDAALDTPDYRGSFRFRLGMNGIWIDHMHVDGFGDYQNTTLASLISLAEGVDFITVSNTIIDRTNRGFLIGANWDEPSSVGKLKTTFDRCFFRNVKQRSPRCRFGQIHIVNSYLFWDNSINDPSTLTTHSYHIFPSTLSENYVQNTYIEGGIRTFTEETAVNESNGGIIFDNVFQTGVSIPATENFNPQLVNWNPNTLSGYNFNLLSPEQAKDYVNQWAGAKYHLKNPIV